MKKSAVILLLLIVISNNLKAQIDVVNKADSTTIISNSIAKANIKVAATYFDCLFKTHDFGTLVKIIAKDAVYTQAEGLPYGGRYIGFSEWVKMFTKAQTLFDLQIVGEPVFFSTEKENIVIINFWIKCKSKRSNKEILMPVAEYYEVKNSLIVSIRPYYFDTKTFTDFLN